MKLAKKWDWNLGKLKSRFSFGSYTALKRFYSFSDALYPQYLTWNRVKLKSELTPRHRLRLLYFFSIFVFCFNFAELLMGLSQILRHQKDLEFSFPQALTLVMFLCAMSVNSTAIISYVLEGDSLRFVLDNLPTLPEDDGMSVLPPLRYS